MTDRQKRGSQRKDADKLLSTDRGAQDEVPSSEVQIKSGQKNSPGAPNPLRKPSVDSPMINFDFKSIRPKDRSSFHPEEQRRVSFKQQLEILEEGTKYRKDSESVVWPDGGKDQRPTSGLRDTKISKAPPLKNQLLSPEGHTKQIKPTRIESEDRNQQAEPDKYTSSAARLGPSGSSPNRLRDVRPTLITSEAEGFSPIAARSEVHDKASFKLRAKKEELDRVEQRLRRIRLEVNQLELEAESEPPGVLVSQELHQPTETSDQPLQFLSPSKDDGDFNIQKYDIRLESEDGQVKSEQHLRGSEKSDSKRVNMEKITPNGNSNETPNPFEFSSTESPQRLTSKDITINPFHSSGVKQMEPQIVVSGPTDFRLVDSPQTRLNESNLRRQNTPNFLTVSSSSEPKQQKQLLPPAALQELEHIIYDSRLVGISQTMERLNTFIQKHQLRKTGFQLLTDSDVDFADEQAQMTPDRRQRSAQISELHIRYNSPPNLKQNRSEECDEQLGSQSRRLLLLKMERELMYRQQPVSIGSKVKLSLSIDGTGRSLQNTKRTQSRQLSGTFQHSKSVETGSGDLRSAIRVNSKTYDSIPEDTGLRQSATIEPKKVLIMPHIYKSATGGRIRSPVRPAVEVVKEIGSLEAQKIRRAGKLPALLRRVKKPSLMSPYYDSELDKSTQRC